MQVVNDPIRDRAFMCFSKIWQRDYAGQKEDSVENYITRLKAAETLGINKQVITILGSHKKFQPLYISKNLFAIMGYQVEEVEKWSIGILFKALDWRQLLLPLTVHRWGNRFINTVPDDFLDKKPNIYFCGLRLHTKAGAIKTFFLSITRLRFDEEGQPTLSLVHAIDISPFIKEEVYWIRFTRGDNNEYVSFFTSKEGRQQFKDLISPRELEVLQLVAAQKDSKEISKLLNISFKTVEKHRKNMIARSCAKDMTALIYLCQLVEII